MPRSVARIGARLASAGQAIVKALEQRSPWVLELIGPWLEAQLEARERALASVAELERELEQERARGRKSEASRVDSDRKLAELRAELDETRARATSEQRARDQRSEELAARNAELHAEIAALAPQLEETSRRLRELEQERRDAADPDDDAGELVPRVELEALRRKERDLLVKASMMSRRIDELTRYADENAALRNRLIDFEASAARAGALARRVKELEARAFAAEPIEAEPVAPAAVAEGDTVGTTLDEQLANVLRAHGGRVAVIADTHGLLLAAAGEREHHESLAAIAGSLVQTATRTTEFLPLGRPLRIELQYADGIGLTTRIFDCEDEPMALTMLRRAELTREAGVETTVGAVVQLIGAPPSNDSRDP